MKDGMTLDQLKQAFETDKIKELEDQIAKITEENRQLKNRCHATSRGILCVFCEFECKNKGVIMPNFS
jgi:hypothetical protein